MKIVCPGCKAEVDQGTACPVCGWAFADPGRSQAASRPSVRVKPTARPKVLPKVDVAITIDATASTLQFEKGVKAMLPMMLKPVEAKASELRCWLQCHRDRNECEQEVLLTDGGTADQAIAEAVNIIFEGGGGPHETHLDGIETLMNLVPWNANPAESRGALIAIVNAESKPAQSGHTPREIGEEMKRRGLLFYLVGEYTPVLRQLTKAAGGMFFPISNNPDPKALERIAQQLAASIVLTVGRSATMPLPPGQPGAATGQVTFDGKENDR